MIPEAKILKEALNEFAQKGFEAASTRSIAANVGIKQSLVTYHFGTKDELWRAVLRQNLGGYRQSLETRIEGLRVSDHTKLRLVQEEFIRFSAANPSFHLLMAGEPTGRRPACIGSPTRYCGPSLSWRSI